MDGGSLAGNVSSSASSSSRPHFDERWRDRRRNQLLLRPEQNRRGDPIAARHLGKVRTGCTISATIWRFSASLKRRR
jgi:hypothetical protein